MQSCELGDALAKTGFIDDRVTPIDAFGPVAGQLHGDRSRDTSTLSPAKAERDNSDTADVPARGQIRRLSTS